MANISITYTFANSTTADATEVNTNFQDIIDGTSDGSKDFSIAALTVAGTTTLNANVNIGNATSDDLTITARVASDIDPKTAATNTLGDATQTWLALYLDGDATDGGAVYFDAGVTEFIKANAGGTDLAVGGFTTMTLIPRLVIPDASIALPAIYSATGTSDTGISMSVADQIHFSAAGSERLEIGDTVCIFNEEGDDCDFRFEGDTEVNLLYLDAGNDRVGINTATPAVNFEVVGDISVDDSIARITSALGTTDGNSMQFEITDSTAGSTRASLGIRYESDATAGPAGFLNVAQRDGTGQYYWTRNSAGTGDFATATAFSSVGTDGGTVVGTQTSDERIKKDIQDLDYGLAEILKLKPIRYVLNELVEIGFGAQTTQPVIPEAVYDTKSPVYPDEPKNKEALKAHTKKEMFEKMVVDDPCDRLAMEYVRIIPVLVNAIKELEARLKLIEVA
tara:strand:+ start:1256 stop:2611 length:1356 start_codon:yes stop_codon:yes gene_type:complete